LASLGDWSKVYGLAARRRGQTLIDDGTVRCGPESGRRKLK